VTTIVWDGRTLAADKLGSNGDLKRTLTKIWRFKHLLIGGNGAADSALMMKHWIENGAELTSFPECQKGDDWCEVVVINTETGEIMVYEKSPIPLVLEDKVYAGGSGRGYALGAIAMGADAKRAVEVAMQFDMHTGLGLDILEAA